MSSSYTVSILVPFYNVERFIERCAHSLFVQRYPDLEFVFVDDGSTDKSAEILEQVIGQYPNRESSVRFIRHEANRGLAAARNTALDHATGAFICFVDADDWMERDGVEQLVAEQVATDADVVWGKALLHSEEGEQVLQEPVYEDLDAWRQCYFRFTKGLVMVLWRRIIRRSLFENHHIRLEEGLHIVDDKQVMPMIAYYAQSFSSLDTIVYHYERRNPDAYTYKGSHGQYMLDDDIREIQGMRRVVRFLAGKESAYLETVQSAKFKRLLAYRKDALIHSSREGFRKMVNWIWETPAPYRDRYGWRLLSWKAWIKSNYTLSRFLYLMKKRVSNKRFGA